VSDRFDLAGVFFAVVLFVAGLTTVIQRRLIQVGFLTLSVIGLAAGIAVLVTTPTWSALT
jgi:NADH:ubiquinone oxidoreductase subunit K